MKLDDIKTLERKIWITKKSRIKASERLNKLDFLSQALTCYYSVIIVCISMINYFSKSNNEKISLFLTVASICLALFSGFIISRNFKERSIYIKYNYIELDKLYFELKKLSENLDTNKEKIDEIDIKYFKILENSENHNEWDYLIAMSESSEPYGIWNYIKKYYYHCNNFFCVTLLLLLPFLVTILLIKLFF